MSKEDEGLSETLEILADSDLLEAVEAGLRDLERGDVLSHDQVWHPAPGPSSHACGKYT